MGERFTISNATEKFQADVNASDAEDWTQRAQHAPQGLLDMTPKPAWAGDEYSLRLQYIICEHNNVISAADQERMAGRAHFGIQRLEGSHWGPFLENREEASKMIKTIVDELVENVKGDEMVAMLPKQNGSRAYGP